MSRTTSQKSPAEAAPPSDAHPFRICLALAALVLIVFWQTRSFPFVNLDDDILVYDNPHITGGLTWDAVRWIWGHFDGNFYIPLTSMSHMLDWSLYGAWAGGHHLTNVLLHLLSTLVLFHALRKMTGALWQSAFVAALFAIHPLHVESVAWVSERKDTLSGVFFMLTLLAYAGYVRGGRRPWRMGMLTIIYTLGLLSKPSLVTVPLVLLLLDYWPLGRFGKEKPAGLILEKLPLAVLSAAACVVAVLAQGDALQSTTRIGIAARIANAPVSYAVYIRQLVYPSGLAAYYPYPPETEWTAAALSLLALAAITAAIWKWRRERKYLLTGWLWYLFMLAPMIGLVQVGAFARADRFTYLPQTGLYLILAWGGAEIAARLPQPRLAASLLMGVVIAELIPSAWVQTSRWGDDMTLWRHALECTTDNDVAHDNLGEAIYRRGDLPAALPHFMEAVRINPANADAQNNLGVALVRMGRAEEALAPLRTALQTDPGLAGAHNNLGNALSQLGRDREAAAEYEKAIGINPRELSALNNLAWLLSTSPDDSVRNGPRAMELIQAAESMGKEQPVVLAATLAAAYAENGDFRSAQETIELALSRVPQSDERMTTALRAQGGMYAAGHPYREQRPARPAGGH